ncbi:hypothetical protein [Culicoidibacter larvae]|uniref:Uncharacterized protein n=1 Tax=Culicoidibacter larvae TaxID=2579976 RepID=A0A5R8QCF9_9FIRM|nr:hypothetical protein [Culicoidibacter larvae]TLG74261.1 hypothetical protein FEZ08_06025 [Culicoidibacter larvae]
MERNVRERLFSGLHHDLHRAEIDALHLPEFTRNSIKIAVILVNKVVPVDGYTNFYRNIESRNIDYFYSATKESNGLKKLLNWNINRIGADTKYYNVSYNETLSEVPVLLRELGLFLFMFYHRSVNWLDGFKSCLGMNKEDINFKNGNRIIECDNTS